MQQMISPPNGVVRSVDLPRSTQAGSRARAFIQMHFGDDLTTEAFDNTQMVVSELVNNAVVHGSGAVALKAQLRGAVVRVEVIDEGSGNAPAVRDQGHEDGGGWGLRIVESLSTEWGAFEGTTHVWAELPAD